MEFFSYVKDKLFKGCVRLFVYSGIDNNRLCDIGKIIDLMLELYKVI